MIIKYFIHIIAVLCFGFMSLCLADNHDDDFLSFAQKKVELAVKSNDIWDGPTVGPRIVRNKKIIFIASDLRNGGVYGVAKGMSEAISNIGWQLNFIDGRGSEVRQGAALTEAIGFKPDAILLGGIDALRHKNILKKAQSLGIVVIGWHASELAGSNKALGLYTNITTDPIEVAEVAALLAIVDSNGQAKIIVFSDPNYKIASMKASVMVDTIKRCSACSVLELKSLPLDKVADEMPNTLSALWEKYNDEITYILTINDLYIDYAIPSLESRLETGNIIPHNISAGDGSKAAYKRINQNNFQLATVPEPLYLQGWQIIDEFNRAFNKHPPSGYSTPVHLVTPDNVDELMNQDTGIYDPKNGYRKVYLNIWKGE